MDNIINQASYPAVQKARLPWDVIRSLNPKSQTQVNGLPDITAYAPAPAPKANPYYATRVNQADYQTTAPAKYRMTADGRVLPNTGGEAVVANPAKQEMTGQDLINYYYNQANMSSAKLTNGIYNVAAALAAKDGYNLNELVQLRGTNIANLAGRFQQASPSQNIAMREIGNTSSRDIAQR